MKRTKKFISLLLTVCLVLSMAMTVATAEDTAAADTGRAIQSGWDGAIKSPTEKSDENGKWYVPSSYIYFGQYNDGADKSPIKWRVLDAEKGNATGEDDSLFGQGPNGNPGAMFLVSEDALGSRIKFDDDSNVYQGSDAQQWCKFFAENSDNFSAAEQNIIVPTSKNDAANDLFYDDATKLQWGTSKLKEDKMFLLSVEECHRYFSTYTLNLLSLAMHDFWLRTPVANNTDSVGCIDGQHGYLVDQKVNSMAAVHTGNSIPACMRPAFNLDKSQILFTQAADNSGHNATFEKPEDYNGNEWKLTLSDGNNFVGDFEDGQTFELEKDYSDAEITIDHPSLNSFSNAGYTDVTALLADENNNLLCYGSINTDKNATQSTVTIPAGLQKGEYSLYIYAEDRNEKCLTDYATWPQGHLIYVDTEPPKGDGHTPKPNPTDPTNPIDPTTDPTVPTVLTGESDAPTTDSPGSTAESTEAIDPGQANAAGTGDSFNLLPWLILATASTIGAVAIASRKRTTK